MCSREFKVHGKDCTASLVLLPGVVRQCSKSRRGKAGLRVCSNKEIFQESKTQWTALNIPCTTWNLSLWLITLEVNGFLVILLFVFVLFFGNWKLSFAQSFANSESMMAKHWENFLLGGRHTARFSASCERCVPISLVSALKRWPRDAAWGLGSYVNGPPMLMTF